MSKLRFRYVYMGIGVFLVLSLMFILDPDSGIVTDLPFGAQTITQLAALAKMVLYVGMFHLSMRALADYLDKHEFMQKAKEHPIGAGLVLVGQGLTGIAVAILSVAALMN